MTFQALFYPVTDAGMDTASYQRYGDGSFWLSASAMKWFWDSYAPEMAQRKEPTASPLQAELSQLQELPPALIIVDENDVSSICYTKQSNKERYWIAWTQKWKSYTLGEFLRVAETWINFSHQERLARGTR